MIVLRNRPVLKSERRGGSSLNDVGILAYGSLIDCPGREIDSVIVERKKDVQTPFKVEFARCSSSRGVAPTLIPVVKGGANVSAVILVLSGVSEEDAWDMLWRRETNNVCTGGKYPKGARGENAVYVERSPGFCDLDVVLHTKIEGNIPNLTPENLAVPAIRSVRCAGEGRDGITYLIRAKENGIRTPLMPDYERAILGKLGADSLEDALRRLRS